MPSSAPSRLGRSPWIQLPPMSIAAWTSVAGFFQNSDFGSNAGNIECSISQFTSQDSSGAQTVHGLSGGLGVVPTGGAPAVFGDGVVEVVFALSLASFADREIDGRGVGVIFAWS